MPARLTIYYDLYKLPESTSDRYEDRDAAIRAGLGHLESGIVIQLPGGTTRLVPPHKISYATVEEINERA